MGKHLRTRYGMMLILLSVLMAVLLIRLFVLTVVTKDTWTDKAENLSVRTITTSAPRGRIYDRNGEVIAMNRQMFNVRIYSSSDDDEKVNDVIYDVVKLLEKNGDKLKQDFPVRIEKNGSFVYTYDKQKTAWLRSEGMPVTYNAEQAFNELINKMNIGDEPDIYKAQIKIQEKGVYPPIAVGDRLQFTYDRDKDEFLSRHGLKDDTDAAEAFRAIREEYGIDEKLSDKEAVKIMSVRNALDEISYKRYMPVTIAEDVSEKTIITVEEESDRFPNIEIASEYARYYPHKALASHILGYMGAISDPDKEKYVDELGYDYDDLIGKDGIEKNYEEQLRGQSGYQKVKVDVYGRPVELLDKEDPVSGKDIYLTVDLKQQKQLERNLEKGIDCVRTGKTFTGNAGSYTPVASPRCTTGAAVILDVKTGEVLAMASCPDFDPNLFASGISQSDWDKLQSGNIRDPLSAQPLYNIAARSAVQPGSTFKPVTATAAMASGLDPKKALHDGGQVRLGDRTFDCLVYTRSHGSHGNVNMAEALGVSCNYYFYDIGQGKDYYTGASLGYKCGTEKILDYAKQYGLGEKTGIEITETNVPAPSSASRAAAVKSSLANHLWTDAKFIFVKDVYDNEELLSKSIDEIASWSGEDRDAGRMKDDLIKYGIRDDAASALASEIKNEYQGRTGWSEGDGLNISIGQGENAYTPLQLANYAATIGNRGKRNSVSVVKSVDGKETEKAAAGSVDLNRSDFKYILRGMDNVCSMPGGSLYGLFNGFDIHVAAKTGTAERAGRINPQDEVDYVKDHFSQLTSSITWDEVEEEMKRLMTVYPSMYKTGDTAVRQALYNLSGRRITGEKIDRFKPEYENFAWTMALAPADKPEIAVCVLLVQGKSSLNAGFITREIIADYYGFGRKGE